MNFPNSPLLPRCLALHREGKLNEASACYVQVLRNDPNNSDALYYVAVIAVQEGKHAEGIRLAQQALAKGTPHARVHNLLGQTYLRSGQTQEALASFDWAIALQPDFVDAHANRADVLADLGRLDEALAGYDRVLELRWDSPEDWSNRATILQALDRTEEALANYDRAIALRPDFAAAHFNRANILKDLRRMDEAIAGYQRAIELQPKLAAAHINHALTLSIFFNRHQEALASIDRALALKPNDPDAITNRGHILRNLGRLDLAESEYAHALRVNPDLSAAFLGRSHIMLERGDFLAARTLAKEAMSKAPKAPEPLFTLAHLQLLMGDWQEGWANYECRNRTLFPAYFSLPYRRWYGEPMPGERLVVMTEQGYGDMMQFCRLVPMLTAAGIDATILTEKKMAALLSTLQSAKIVTTTDEIDRDPKPVRWIPMMSLPGILGLKPDTVPTAVPYLSSEPDRIATWARNLGHGGFKIGIAWQPGSPPNWLSNKRAVPLAAFAPLADIAGVRLFSLQKGNGSEQIATVSFGSRIETFGEDFDSGPNAFLDTAAVMMNLDLVVTCDTSIAHLAGALARPVSVALAFTPDWRWQIDREDSPWYPTLQLFRQRENENWSPVLKRIAQAVSAKMSLPQVPVSSRLNT